MSEHRFLHVESPARIGLDTGRLCIRTEGREPWFGCVEDIAALSLSDPAITISTQALRTLAENGAVVLVNDASHLPVALAYPMQASTLAAGRIRRQAEWRVAHPDHAGVLWAEVVHAKLRMQGETLKQCGLNGHLRLFRLADRVEPNDPSNLEAQGARHYWKHLFGGDFRRNKRDATDHLNHKLNYGYAVLRALVARHLALAGLEPALGIQHASGVNRFNLADDLMEPFRPLVDAIVCERLLEEAPLGRDEKRALIGLIEHSVIMSDGREYRLHAAMDTMIASLVRAMEANRALVLPTRCRNGGQ